MKKIIIILLTVFIIILIGFIFSNKYRYKIDLPDADKISSIYINNEEKIIKERSEINNILNIIEGNGRKTNKHSVNDGPINAINIIKIELELIDNNKLVIFVYEENEKYYIEQPYNGIYSISKEEYRVIKEQL